MGERVKSVEMAGLVLLGEVFVGLLPVGVHSSGMVPQPLKKTPNRLGTAAAWARLVLGIIASKNGRATLAPKAPRSMVRRESLWGMLRTLFCSRFIARPSVGGSCHWKRD